MPELLDIVGQDGALTAIQRCLTGPRRAHAYLFAGPQGVGRRTTAQALAAAILCERPAMVPNAGRLPGLPDDARLRQGCGACPDCRMLAAGTHGDFHLVYKELARYHDDREVRQRVMQDLGIDVVRQFLLAPASRSPVRGRGKVFVVLEAELMSDAAQNALLKTLEEPPPGVAIILICRRPEDLLPTTVSRCWTVRFGPLPRNFVARRLLEAGADAQEAAFWAAFTDGAVGRALRLARPARSAAQGMYAVKRELLERLAGLGAGNMAKLADHLVKVTDKLADEAVAEARKADGAELSRLLAFRRAAGIILELMASAYRDAMAAACGAGGQPVHADQPAAIAALARRFRPAQLAEIIEQLGRYEQLLWRNVSPKTVWDNVAITCASAAPLRV